MHAEKPTLRSSHWAAVLLVTVLAGCADGTAPSRIPSAGVSSAGPSVGEVPTPSATPPPTPRPTPTAAVGRTCVTVGDEACTLESGAYRTVHSFPGMTYSVPNGGWGSVDQAGGPGNFLLVPRGASVEGALDGASDDIIFFGKVAVPGHCTGEPLTNAATTFDSFVAFITKHPHLVVKDVRDVSVGGLDGKAIDLAIDDVGDGCDQKPHVDLLAAVDPTHGSWGIEGTPGRMIARMYVLDNHGAPLVIEVDDVQAGSTYGDGAPWLSVADGVVNTIDFAE